MSSKQRDLELKLRRQIAAYQPLEIMQLRAVFPNLDELIEELYDLYQASIPGIRAQQLGVGRGNGDPNRTTAHGASLQGGEQQWPAQDRIHEVNRQLASLARRVFDETDRPPRSHVKLGLKTRRCRHQDCGMFDRRQYGFLDVETGRYLCRDCNRELKGGNDARR